MSCTHGKGWTGLFRCFDNTEKSVINRTSPVLPLGMKNAAEHQGEYSVTGSIILFSHNLSSSALAGTSIWNGYFLETEMFRGVTGPSTSSKSIGGYFIGAILFTSKIFAYLVKRACARGESSSPLSCLCLLSVRRRADSNVQLGKPGGNTFRSMRRLLEIRGCLT